MTEERETLRRGVSWVRGMADAVRRALAHCDPDLEMDLGGEFQVRMPGKPTECGPNLIGSHCFPPAGPKGSEEVVRIRDLINTLAALDELAGLIQGGLEPPSVDPRVLDQISERVPRPR
jgi:hypothetical protein